MSQRIGKVQKYEMMSTNDIQSVIEDLFPSFRQQEQQKEIPSTDTNNKKKKMYEQSLDAEYFHPSYNNMYHPESQHFYDDYNNNNNYIKNHPSVPSPPYLPTPPSTPDKIPMSYGNFNHPVASAPPPYMTSHSYHHQTSTQNNQFSPTCDMQVVPDFFGGKDDENINHEVHHPYANHHLDENYNPTATPPHYLHLQPTHQQHNNEMPDIGQKRVYNSINHNAQSPIDFYMTNSNHENNYIRQQMAYEAMFHGHPAMKRQRYDSHETIEPELSRATHNILERQRRNDLKLRFSILRDNIPELASHEKAPKIQILRKGLEYLTILKSEEQKLIADKELEKQRKLILMERLKTLRQSNH
ncbi:uncharacterized protein [Clytia hemisphaerica]|uniref:BHLH domain-containing protein n=1 Tax=Clytia hemisphaerica TaxID=252671 RepID=A0A7M5U0P9_9CNID|eukprot:TCONS_00012631-protein